MSTNGIDEGALSEVYAERNQVAMLMAAIVVSQGGSAGWAKDEAQPNFPVLIVDLPDGSGQTSWHIPAQQATQFDIGPYDGEWDGHTSSDKRKRMVEFMQNITDAQVPRMSDE